MIDDEMEPRSPDWKMALRVNFEAWLAELPDEAWEDAGTGEGEEEPAEAAPDLMTFYGDLAAAQVEQKKAHRRTAETLAQWGELMGKFDRNQTELQARLQQDKPRTVEQLPRGLALGLVELTDRLQRLAKAWENPPIQKRRWLGPADDTAWQERWQQMQDAWRILSQHAELFQAKAGLERRRTLGTPFDPTTMTAVETRPVTQGPVDVVVEEGLAGYFLRGEILRPAQVTVSVPA